MRATLQAKTVRSSVGAGAKPSRPVRASASVAASPQAFFSSWTHEANSGQLPSRVQEYLSLLAESTTTQGGMQKHLVKIMAKGAGHAFKMSDVALNPLDTLSDYVADAGTDYVMKQFHTPNSHWSKLRSAVLGTSMFKAAGKGATHDDSYTPAPKVDPVHAKALGLLVSVLMSGAVSGAAHALPADMPFMHTSGAGVEMSQSHSVSVKSSFEHAPSFRAAPSFALKADGEVVSTGGMAASTAMKLLRADSKVGDMIPDLKDIFTSAMDSIEECDEGALDKIASSINQNRFSKANAFGNNVGNVNGGAPAV